MRAPLWRRGQQVGGVTDKQPLFLQWLHAIATFLAACRTWVERKAKPSRHSYRGWFGCAHPMGRSCRVEALEPRALLSTVTVSTANDVLDGDTSSIANLVANPGGDGMISLREAITAANNSPGLDIISFNIPGSGVQTIMPKYFLPAITSPVEIHGETQPSYAGQPLIELDGTEAGLSNGLDFEVGGNFVEGLDIHSFSYDGIVFHETDGASATGGNTVFANFLGTDPTGTVAKANGFDGIHLLHSPTDMILDNLISGNTADGIYVADQFSTGTQIEGNLIGTDITGLKPLGNGLNGVNLSAEPSPAPGDGYASGNTVGGTSTDDRNVISDNGQSGVYIAGGTNNTVAGNYIGLGKDGAALLGNGSIDDPGSAQFGIDGVYIDSATDNHIGGTATGAGNLISDNQGSGVVVTGTAAEGNVIAGNSIGTNGAGGYAIGYGNVFNGILFSNSGSNTATSNVIGGNTDGITITRTAHNSIPWC